MVRRKYASRHVCANSIYETDANERAVWIMKPIIDGKAVADRLKSTLSLIDKHRYLFDLPASLQNSISVVSTAV